MFPVYQGVPRQYGHGLGTVFKSAAKSVKPLVSPMVKSAFNALKNEGLKQGMSMASEIMAGRSPKQVVKQRAKKALKSVGKATALSLGESLLKSIKGKKSKPRRHSTYRPRRRRSRKPKRATRALDIFD